MNLPTLTITPFCQERDKHGKRVNPHHVIGVNGVYVCTYCNDPIDIEAIMYDLTLKRKSPFRVCYECSNVDFKQNMTLVVGRGYRCADCTQSVFRQQEIKAKEKHDREVAARQSVDACRTYRPGGVHYQS